MRKSLAFRPPERNGRPQVPGEVSSLFPDHAALFGFCTTDRSTRTQKTPARA
jgi:hypothetical protein